MFGSSKIVLVLKEGLICNVLYLISADFYFDKLTDKMSILFRFTIKCNSTLCRTQRFEGEVSFPSSEQVTKPLSPNPSKDELAFKLIEMFIDENGERENLM